MFHIRLQPIWKHPGESRVHPLMKHALTIDVEDWHSGISLGSSHLRSEDYRLKGSMESLLAILDLHGVKASFFWLGELAVKYPELVRTVAEAGHSTDCHGWSHEFACSTDPNTLKEQIYRARSELQAISGQDVTSYRAPYFSVSRNSLWILDVVAGLGFKIDSSIFPVLNYRYGIPGFPGHIHEISTSNGPLCMAPVTTRKAAWVSIPVSGGAYFRIYPYPLTRMNIRHCERKRQPVVFYLHPWELDPDHPRVAFCPLARTTHYANLKSCGSRFRKLLGDFEFQPLEHVVHRETGMCHEN